MHLLARFQYARVPSCRFSKRQTRIALAALVNQQIIMSRHEIEPLLIRRDKTYLPGLLPRAELHENPGVEQSAAANGDAGTAGFVKHSLGIRDAAHVAVA